MRNVSIDFGSENICKSRENSIGSDDSPAEVRMVECVTVPATRIMCGRTALGRIEPRMVANFGCWW